MILQSCKALITDAITGAIWLVRACVSFVFEFFGSQWRQYTAFGQLLFLLAVVMIGVDAGISYQYGLKQSELHAWAFAGIAVAFALFPDVAVTEARKGNWWGAGAMSFVAVVTAGIIAQSHLGYGGGIRMAAIQDNSARLSLAADVRGGATSEAKNINTLRLALDTATKERDDLKEANPWSTATTAPALEAEIANAEGDHVFKRSKQCKDVTLPESRAYCDRLTATRTRLAAIKQLNAASDRMDQLQRQIETAQARLDKRTAEAAETAPPPNTIANQTTIAAVLVNWWSGKRGEAALTPTATEQHATNIMIAGFNSLGMLLVACTLMVGAGLNRVTGALGWHGGGGGGLAHPALSLAPAATPGALAARVGAAGNHPDLAAAMAAAAARRASVTQHLVTMRQSRVDGGLLSRAA